MQSYSFACFPAVLELEESRLSVARDILSRSARLCRSCSRQRAGPREEGGRRGDGSGGRDVAHRCLDDLQGLGHGCAAVPEKRSHSHGPDRAADGLARYCSRSHGRTAGAEDLVP